MSYLIGLSGLLVLASLPWTKHKIMSLLRPAFSGLVSKNEYRDEIKGRAGRICAFIVAAGGVWFCVGWGCFGVLLGVNAALDFSQPVIHQTVILNFSAGNGERASELKVASWRSGRSTESVQIRYQETELIFQGERRVNVTTKKGALGFEWVREVKVVPEPSRRLRNLPQVIEGK
ncbi:MAG: hypothetical protein HZA89_18350 [Verrucomicrobia bacterium]|nr:hypothetical protein [Verrucomicrobiota bacterium]